VRVCVTAAQISSRFNTRTRKLIPYSIVGISMAGAVAVLMWRTSQTPSFGNVFLAGLMQSWLQFALGNLVYELRRFVERRKLRRLALGIMLNLAVGLLCSIAGYLSCSYIVLSISLDSGVGSVIINGKSRRQASPAGVEVDLGLAFGLAGLLVWSGLAWFGLVWLARHGLVWGTHCEK
jgi:hypothetical protein